MTHFHHEQQTAGKIAHELHRHSSEAEHQASRNLSAELYRAPEQFGNLLKDINKDLHKLGEKSLCIHHDQGKHISHIDFGQHDIYKTAHPNGHKPAPEAAAKAGASATAHREASPQGTPEVRLHGGDKIAQAGERSLAPSGINFNNVDASPQFQNQVQDAFRNSFGNLNPETQEKLKGLEVVTASRINKVFPEDSPMNGASTPRLKSKDGNKMVFGEKGIKAAHEPIQNVTNHEIFHAVDNATGATKDPVLRRALDLGFSRLPKSVQRQENAMTRTPEEINNRYMEYAADLSALHMGTPAGKLTYLGTLSKHPETDFKEALELMKEKYFK